MSLEELEKKIVNYFNNNEMRKAEDFVKKMLHIDPKNPHVKMYLIMIKIETGHFSEALGLLSSLGKEAEKTKAYWKWLGLIKTGLNDIPEAINAYQKALELEPKYTDVYWLLLKLLEKFDLPAAIEYLYKAIRNIGYTKDFDVKLKKYQNLLARKKGIHAPIEMTISNNKGTIKIKNTPLGSITKIQELDKTSFILTELQLQHTNLEKIDGLDNLQHLTYLSLSYNNIEKIEGLERLHNLKNLYLYKNKISKIEGLEKLTNLETLELGYNNIEKIESLEKLQKLNKLCLNGNKIKSITGLEKLTALRTLKLYNNQIEKIKGLDTLENLETLSLGENKISDISGLEKLRNLKYLKLNKNEINSMDGIEKVPTLSKLNLKDNQLKMINHLDKLPLLERLELQGNTDLHSYLTNNPIIIKPQNFRNQRDSFKYSILMDCCGLTNEETAKMLDIKTKERDIQQKQKKAKILFYKQISSLPKLMRLKYKDLLTKIQKGYCLYCGSKLPDKKNWVTYCQKKVDSILKKANDKLPKKLLPKFDIEIETTEMGPGYYDKSNPAKWEYSHSRTGFNLKKFDRIKRSPKKFYKKDFATPQSSLCKKCADDFIARVTKIFSSVSGTRFAKKHAKIYDKITTEYLQVFEELIDNAP